MKTLISTILVFISLFATAGAQPLPITTPEEVGLSSERLARIKPLMQKHIDDGTTAGILTMIARKGKIAHLEMVGMQDIANQKPISENDVLKTLAVARFVDQENAKILITTAFETLSKDARKKGLLSGANSVMLNATPFEYRKLYSIYPDRAHEQENIKDQIDDTISLLRQLGRAPTDLGVNA